MKTLKLILTATNIILLLCIYNNLAFGQEKCRVPLRPGEVYILSVNIHKCVLSEKGRCKTFLDKEKGYLYEINITDVHFLGDTSIYTKKTILEVKYLYSRFELNENRAQNIYCLGSGTKEYLLFEEDCLYSSRELLNLDFYYPLGYITKIECVKNRKDPYVMYINKVKSIE